MKPILHIVKNPEKASYGRPFFVCPKDVRCGYFEWADERIHEKPMCRCGKKCVMFAVKKECPNKGRFFFYCPEKRKKSCRFFVWTDEHHREEVFTRPPTLPAPTEIKAHKKGNSFGRPGSEYKEKYLEAKKNVPGYSKSIHQHPVIVISKAVKQSLKHSDGTLEDIREQNRYDQQSREKLPLIILKAIRKMMMMKMKTHRDKNTTRTLQGILTYLTYLTYLTFLTYLRWSYTKKLRFFPF